MGKQIKYKFELGAEYSIDKNGDGVRLWTAILGCNQFVPAGEFWNVTPPIPVTSGDKIHINRANVAMIISSIDPSTCTLFEVYGRILAPFEGKDDIIVEVPPNSGFMLIETASPWDWENLKVTIIRDVKPNYSDDLAKETVLELNQQFFREKLTADLKFGKNDFRFIDSQPFDTRFKLDIFRSFDNGRTFDEKPYASGLFFKIDCEFDRDNQFVSVTPTPNDRYDEILGGLDKEFDLIQLKPEIERIEMHRRPIIQVYRLGDNSISCFSANDWWEQDAEVITNRNRLTGRGENDFHFAHHVTLQEFRLNLGSGNALNGVYVGTFSGFGTSNSDVGVLRRSPDDLFRVEITVAVVLGFITQVFFRVIQNSNNFIVISNTLFGTIMQNRDISDLIHHEPENYHLATNFIYARWVLDKERNDAPPVEPHGTRPISSNDITRINPNFRFAQPMDNNAGFAEIHNTTSTKQTQWGVRDDGLYYDNPQIGVRLYHPIARSRWGWASMWFRRSSFFPEFEEQRIAPFVSLNNKPIHSVISVLLRAIGTNITFENNPEYSEILFGNIANFNNDPIFITQKTNVLNSNHDQPAQRAPITLGNVFDMLNTMKLYWHLDGDKLRIEHISFYKNGGSYLSTPEIGLDLTKVAKTRIPKPWVYLTNRYKFDKTDIPSRIQFHWADRSSDVFAGSPIDPISNFVQRGRVEDIHIRGFSADIDLMLSNPQEFSNDGFAIIKAKNVNGRFILPIEMIGGHKVQNPYMSFYHIHSEFWLHDLPTKFAMINGEKTEAKSTMQIKTQEIGFPLIVRNFDPQKLVKTGLGDGRVRNVSEKLSSNFSTVELRYDAE